MKYPARMAAVAAAWLLAAGCATTGDPREGGLFGWSEAKARDRQRERQVRADAAQVELTRETSRGVELEAKDAAAERQRRQAGKEHTEGEGKLRALHDSLVAKTQQLEEASITPAEASRARAYRRKVDAAAAQTMLPLGERGSRLKALEIAIDAAIKQSQR